MKNLNGEIEYKNKKYKLVFNLNVMEQIQDEYKTLDEWGKLSDGSEGEPNVKAIIFGFTTMLNEGIDIDNEENGTDIKPFTLKQVGRMITELGLTQSSNILNKTVIESTKSDNPEKN